MAVVFSVRGVLAARYSNGGNVGMGFGNTAPASAADAGALSGNSIQFAANANNKIVVWPGRSNTPNGRAHSILVRYRPSYTGSPAANAPIFHLGTGGGTKVNTLELYHSTAGTLLVHARNELGTNCINSVSAGSWSPTANTWYDVVLTWDGTTGANSCTVYVDGVAIGSITPAAAFTASWTNQYFSNISIGLAVNALALINGGRIDEIVIWDTVIDPTNVTLESGAGSLDGAARVSLVAATALDGALWTALTADKIKTGESQTQAGVAVSGTYTGSDRWTDPGEGNVASGVAYKANSTTNNKTGTLVATTIVAKGTSIGAGSRRGGGISL